MPPSNSASILTAISETLNRMDKRAARATEQGETSTFEHFHDVGLRAGQGAAGLAGLAVAATGPNLGGTIYANTRSLLGEIGSNQAMVDQVARLSQFISRLKDSWMGLNPEVQKYAINTTLAVAATGTLFAGITRLQPVLASLASVVSPYLSPTRIGGNVQSRGGAALEIGGSVVNTLRGSLDTHLGGMAIGASVFATGAGLNQVLGRNLVGDSLQAGGLLYGGYQTANGLRAAGTALTARAAGFAEGSMAARGFLTGGTAFSLASRATLPLLAFAAVQQFESTPGQATSANFGQRRIEERLSAIDNGAGNRIGNLERVSDARRRNLRELGYTDRQIDTAVANTGTGGWTGSFNFAPPMGQNNVSNIARELTNPGSSIVGSAANLRGQQSEVLQALNFQSRQFGIENLHDVIQQQAVMDPAQRNERQQLLTTLERLNRAIEALERGSTAGSPVATGGTRAAGTPVAPVASGTAEAPGLFDFLFNSAWGEF